ncbi:MAG: HAD family phosphatase [Lachnospiraceae bacterium]|nr:HAD family phosphatase [Lachnospiraceae bacterium]
MIKNLIFDVGGVLIGYRWKEMLTADFGMSDDEAEKMAHMIFEDPIWREFDRGCVDIDSLVEYYVSRHPDMENDLRRFFYGNDKMATEREAVWERIRQLKEKGYNIYILSNYSEYLFKKHTDPMPFRKMIDGGIVSYQAGTIKPEAEIYKHLLDKYDLDPKECMFFDDIKANVDAAGALGIDAVLVTSEESLLEDLGGL